MQIFKILAELEITHGGNLRELELSLFDTLPDGSRRLFPFTLRDKFNSTTKVKLLIAVDSARRYGKAQFRVEGKVVSSQENIEALSLIIPQFNYYDTEVWASYSTGNRKGKARIMCE